MIWGLVFQNIHGLLAIQRKLFRLVIHLPIGQKEPMRMGVAMQTPLEL